MDEVSQDRLEEVKKLFISGDIDLFENLYISNFYKVCLENNSIKVLSFFGSFIKDILPEHRFLKSLKDTTTSQEILEIYYNYHKEFLDIEKIFFLVRGEIKLLRKYIFLRNLYEKPYIPIPDAYIKSSSEIFSYLFNYKVEGYYIEKICEEGNAELLNFLIEKYKYSMTFNVNVRLLTSDYYYLLLDKSPDFYISKRSFSFNTFVFLVENKKIDIFKFLTDNMPLHYKFYEYLIKTGFLSREIVYQLVQSIGRDYITKINIDLSIIKEEVNRSFSKDRLLFRLPDEIVDLIIPEKLEDYLSKCNITYKDKFRSKKLRERFTSIKSSVLYGNSREFFNFIMKDPLSYTSIKDILPRWISSVRILKFITRSFNEMNYSELLDKSIYNYDLQGIDFLYDKKYNFVLVEVMNDLLQNPIDNELINLIYTLDNDIFLKINPPKTIHGLCSNKYPYLLEKFITQAISDYDMDKLFEYCCKNNYYQNALFLEKHSETFRFNYIVKLAKERIILDYAIIESIPKIKGEVLPGMECSICGCEDSNVKTLCSHYYHSVCISQWYSKGGSCPICRNEINFVYY